MAQYATHNNDDIYSHSAFLSPTQSRKSPAKQSLHPRKSTASLRGTPVLALNSSLGNSNTPNSDDSAAPNGNGRHHSLAHELAVALMPEPSAGSKLLAEEFGIEFDEGAEGIDEEDDDDQDESAVGEDSERGGESVYDEHSSEGGHDVQFAAHDGDFPSFANELVGLGSSGGHNDTSFEAESPTTADEEQFDLDPVFHSPTVGRFRGARQRTPEKDAMDVLSENVEFADKFLAQLRTLDTDPGGSGSSSSSQQPNLERMAAGIVRRINEISRERESQVRELFQCEREFRKIGGEVNGGDVLGQLDELEQIEDLNDSDLPSSTNLNQQALRTETRQLHTLDEEPSSPGPQHHFSHSYHNDWELDPDRNHLGDADYDASPVNSPIKDTFLPAPTLQGPVTPAKVVAQLAHIRTFTTSVASSLTSISEHAQVTGVATTDAGRKIRSLKNKLGDLKTEWDNAERSKARIERWEAGLLESDNYDSKTIPSSPTTPSRASRRIDGRKLVQEHLQAFEQALVEAALKTQAIMARSR